MAAVLSTTKTIAMISSSRMMICPKLSSNVSNRCNLMSRRYLSNNSNRSSSATAIQNLAIFAIAGGLGYSAVTLFNSSNGGNNDEPTLPQAPITSRVYFDINVQSQPLGRIVIGLYGSTTPKTVQNFETLCKGTKANGRQIG